MLSLLKSVMRLPVFFFVNTMWICVTMEADFQCFLLQICKSKEQVMKELKRTITKYSETYTELVLFTELLNQVHT